MVQNKIEKLARELGEALGDGILLSWCATSEVSRFKKTFDLEKIESAEEEYFYLMMFLTTYSCQIAFANNKKLLEITLNSFHKYVTEKKFNLPLEILEAQEMENKLRNRYAQYYKLSRTKEHNIDLDFLMQQLPYEFFANVLKKDLNYIFNDKEFREHWGTSTVKLSLLIGEVLKETTRLISKVKDKYKI